ncbi:MAG: mechanosensitive ion channel family protein, partial [Syntrophobacteraceae bacterium]|nr:mechanosensitive ion channel family protein [Syntrophobacteraceae bacterium]
IRELEKSAAGSAGKQEKPQAAGLAGIVQNVEENMALFHKRLTDLQSGAVAVPTFLPKAYADLRGKGGVSNIILMFAAIVILLAGGLGAEWLFGRYAADMRKRLTTSPPAHWTVKIKRLLLCGMIDFICICVFSVATLVLFFLFFNRGPAARLALMTYLVVVLIVRGVGLLSRFFLAPETPALRHLPLEDSTALSIHRWTMRIVLVLGAGFLIRALLELQGTSEEIVIFIRALTAAVVLSIVVYLVFDNRDSVARIICRGAGDHSAGTNLLRAQLATFWHLLALPYVVLAWVLWVFYLLVGRYDLVVPILALFSSVPLFIILDWLGQKLLSAIFGLVDTQEAIPQECDVEAATDGEEVTEPTVREAKLGVDHVGRFVPILRHCLSFSLAGIILFWLLDLWGFEVRLGEQVTGAALKILLIVSLAYVAWRLIEEAINRKLKEVRGNVEVDEDSDEGGTGGSRIGTLLQIFRKFLLVVLLVTVGLIVLSAMGIDTKPLLAGAGILGLAIGLGSQNLIKDIVSGLFFLVDDAFRIGDYVESGKAKGVVEKISIRSLRLRHPRGQVHIVPFSQLGMVTNFSRDYIIVKLDFRVPFGTDIDQVRKVVKKINKEVQEDEEMGSNLLGPIKFAGVLAFDESALIMRTKFKSKPGLQFMVQRQVLRRLQELFDERGLQFATRDVQVRMSEDPTSERRGTAGETSPDPATSSRKRGLSAAAGAAIATAIADEEAKKKQMEEESSKD